MKKNSSLLYIGIPLLLLFIAVSVFTFGYSREKIQKGYLASEGNAAENFAVLAAANLRLTDGQVELLRQCSYKELVESDENKLLENMMKSDGFSRKVDYAYVMVHLGDDEVRYSVTEESRERYDAPIGTKLDIMWLLDVNVSENDTPTVETAENVELNRYSYYIEEDDLILGEKPSYIYHASEWGNHICGYAPLYSTTGQYIGALGVELQTDDYDAYCGTAVFALQVLLAVTLVLFSLLFMYIYLQHQKVQFDKIYIDPLTGVYNRSYYNSRFAKTMNRGHSGQAFALMIADIDWFKRVNDTFGHYIGDSVLTELGGILTDVFGKKNVIRFGGEEFIIGVRYSEDSEIPALLKNLYDRISAHAFATEKIALTISLGCAKYRPENISEWLLSEMLKCADCKLYEAKESGRNRYIFEDFSVSKQYSKQQVKK